MMKYGSVCSGVEAATAAWHPLGWEPQWFSEIEKFPSAVLEHHYPNTPNLGDMTQFKEWPNDPIDLLVGGTPCQSFSVAGLRKGLDDPRGNLMLTYLAIAERYQPRWLVWENVAGVLSSNRGRDFGTFLAALGQIGFGFAYRMLDAQYFGVAQRRRRVFVVGYLGDWRRAAAVLFERESLSGHPAPSRESREEVAQCLTTRTGKYSEGVGTVRAGGDLGGGSETPAVMAFQQNTRDEVRYIGGDGKIAGALAANAGMKQTNYILTKPVAIGWNSELNGAKELMPTIKHGGQGGSRDGVMQPDMQVRRLTPVEYERLQGFPDNYTQIAWRNKLPEDCPDGPRHKAMGNSMAVPVMRWIGERIQMVEDME